MEFLLLLSHFTRALPTPQSFFQIILFIFESQLKTIALFL